MKSPNNCIICFLFDNYSALFCVPFEALYFKSIKPILTGSTEIKHTLFPHFRAKSNHPFLCFTYQEGSRIWF